MSRGQCPVTEQEVNQRFSRRSPASGPPSPPRMTMSWGEQPAPARGRPGVRIKNPGSGSRIRSPPTAGSSASHFQSPATASRLANAT